MILVINKVQNGDLFRKFIVKNNFFLELLGIF